MGVLFCIIYTITNSISKSLVIHTTDTTFSQRLVLEYK